MMESRGDGDGEGTRMEWAREGIGREGILKERNRECEPSVREEISTGE